MKKFFPCCLGQEFFSTLLQNVSEEERKMKTKERKKKEKERNRKRMEQIKRKKK